ncbi:MAG: allantoicase [Zoogloeaceae bacterium]|jgi:allantoicase|nr:allantoicase [Zoogloeaceae bacterium]
MTAAMHTPRTADPAVLPSWAARAVNLADPRLGGEALACSDDFFAPMARLLDPGPACFIPGKYDDHGKWMDGWESRRKRAAGHDWCIVRLGCPGRIFGFDLDTSFFTGNYPPAASIEGCPADGDPDGDHWRALTPTVALQGNRHHLIEAGGAGDIVYSHVRINIFPDGGLARLRVYGQPLPQNPQTGPEGWIDLAAARHGGRAVAWNDAHYGAAANLLLPGRGIDMGDGWETRRRREPGHDWCLIALGIPGTVLRIEVDTAHFKGNFPDRCSLQAAWAPTLDEAALPAQSQFWPTLLAENALAADSLRTFIAECDAPVSHVRFNLHPDGGVSRLRLWGLPAREAR